MALDPETAAVLTERRDHCRACADPLDLIVDKDAFVFSPQLDGSRFLAPSSLTQRYDRLAKRLEVETTFHELRHYSATELIAAGVDICTVAGRLVRRRSGEALGAAGVALGEAVDEPRVVDGTVVGQDRS